MTGPGRRFQRAARRLAGHGLVVLVGALLAPALAAAATPGALTQYAGAGDNWATTGATGSGYSLAGTLGFLAPYPTPGTVPLYGCVSGADHFLSLSSSCEGDTMLGTLGWIYSSPPASAASAPVYDCLTATPASEDHFASTDPHCEGQMTLGLLGYVLGSAALNRYNGGVHWVTTGSVPSGFSLEGTLGYLVPGGPGTQALYGCAAANDHFLSLDPGCEGQTTLGLEGWIYTSPPANVASNPIYRCRTSGDHFASVDPHCEGQITEGLLGYALQAPVPVPTAAASPSAATAIPQPLRGGPGHGRRLLHVRIVFRWRWQRAVTRLTRVQIGRLPGSARVRITCRGRGRTCSGRSRRARAGHLRGLKHWLTGRRYRAGDRLYVAVTARGYVPQQAEIRIRNGKLPAVSLL